MAALSLDQVLKDVQGAARGPVGFVEFTAVSTDSRSVPPGALFIALKGPNFDGHQFVEQARKRGARGAVVSDLSGQKVSPRFPLIVVADTHRALLDLAQGHRSRHAATVIGITGSNGKTTTKDLTGSVLAAHAPTVTSAKSFNNRIGLPLTLLGLDQETRYAVVEMGSSGKGEIAELASTARPQVGVLTNVTHAHLQGLGTLDGVMEEKADLLRALPKSGLAVLNADDPRFEPLRERTTARVVSFALQRRATYTATDVRWDMQRLAFRLNGKDRVLVRLAGCHNVANTLAALAVALELGAPMKDAVRALRSFAGRPGRLCPLTIGQLLLIDDTYNANPGSMGAAIKTFSLVRHPGRRVLVLGDMRELGADAERLHREVGAHLSIGGFDLVIGVGPLTAFLLEAVTQRGFNVPLVRHFATTEEALRAVPGLLLADDAVLVKGSRALGLERVVETVRDWALRATQRTPNVPEMAVP
ncbi:MAG: UDP-N-acetylmuramoyl-tripeptide--D-alanyl-D-alanine ligase [Planctomycetota bacterium]